MASNRPLDTNPRVGRIRICCSNQTIGRYIAKTFNKGSGALETTNSSADALQVRITPTNLGKDYMEITNTQENDLAWLGTSFRSATPTLGKDSSEWASLTLVNGPGAKPTKHAGPDTAGPVGKKIWDVALDGRIVGTWQDDENLVSYQFYFIYSVGQNCIYAVTSQKAFRNNNPEQRYEDLILVFEPAA
ncbi:hypothetical protein FRB90_004440 [Tulasnella sp. 427]|nr:hypothetical protein FRB90_004440 [Tulasnella sp. 427]